MCVLSEGGRLRLHQVLGNSVSAEMGFYSGSMNSYRKYEFIFESMNLYRMYKFICSFLICAGIQGSEFLLHVTMAEGITHSIFAIFGHICALAIVSMWVLSSICVPARISVPFGHISVLVRMHTTPYVNAT